MEFLFALYLIGVGLAIVSINYLTSMVKNFLFANPDYADKIDHSKLESADISRLKLFLFSLVPGFGYILAFVMSTMTEDRFTFLMDSAIHMINGRGDDDRESDEDC
jgi:hypothetical protein